MIVLGLKEVNEQCFREEKRWREKDNDLDFYRF